MIVIDVHGIPRPGGSKVPGQNRRTGKLFVRPASPLTAVWRSYVVEAAARQYKGTVLSGAVTMKIDFRFQRPLSHYRRRKGVLVLREDAPTEHITKPDLTKLVRSTEDALTGIVWRDDCTVWKRLESKVYCAEGQRPGARITIFDGEATC